MDQDGGGRKVADILGMVGTVPLGDQELEDLAMDLLTVVSEEDLSTLVEEDDPPVLIDRDDSIGCHLDDRGLELMTPREGIDQVRHLPAAITSRTCPRRPAEPNSRARSATNRAYSSMKSLPGSRRSKPEGSSRKNSRCTLVQRSLPSVSTLILQIPRGIASLISPGSTPRAPGSRAPPAALILSTSSLGTELAPWRTRGKPGNRSRIALIRSRRRPSAPENL